MTKENEKRAERPDRPGPYRVRLPGFIPPEAEHVGLGDAIARITYAAGIRPCGGCQQRTSRLNGWVVFTR